MKIKYHFISGLPRSGSTLLSAILRQNPRFHAAMTSPVVPLVTSVQTKMNGGEFGVFFDDESRANVLRSVFDGYYQDKRAGIPEGGVIFDTNRTWSGRAAMTSALFPESKIICCVRDIGWIIDSVESMLAKNPLQLSRIFGFQPSASVSSRVEHLMNHDKGLIGLSWCNLRDAWYGTGADRLIVVPYDSLVKHPARTVARLYAALGEQEYEHDFDNVEYNEPGFDLASGMPGLHSVRKSVEYKERKLCIAPEIFHRYDPIQFWKNPEKNVRDVKVI